MIYIVRDCSLILFSGSSLSSHNWHDAKKKWLFEKQKIVIEGTQLTSLYCTSCHVANQNSIFRHQRGSWCGRVAANANVEVRTLMKLGRLRKNCISINWKRKMIKVWIRLACMKFWIRLKFDLVFEVVNAFFGIKMK